VVCLVLPVLQNVSEEEWKTCVFLWLALRIWVVLNTMNVTRKDEANCVMLWEKYDRQQIYQEDEEFML
jgi:hypothetical protein